MSRPDRESALLALARRHEQSGLYWAELAYRDGHREVDDYTSRAANHFSVAAAIRKHLEQPA